MVVLYGFKRMSQMILAFFSILNNYTITYLVMYSRNFAFRFKLINKDSVENVVFIMMKLCIWAIGKILLHIVESQNAKYWLKIIDNPYG